MREWASEVATAAMERWATRHTLVARAARWLVRAGPVASAPTAREALGAAPAAGTAARPQAMTEAAAAAAWGPQDQEPGGPAPAARGPGWAGAEEAAGGPGGTTP